MKERHHRIIASLIAGGLAATTACVDAGDDPPEEGIDEGPGEVTRLFGEEGAGAGTFGAFEVGNTWTKDHFTVCWMPEIMDSSSSDVSDQRQRGQAVVMKEWARVGRIRIDSWWPSCDTRPDSDIRIGMVENDPTLRGRSEIGTDALAIPIGQPTMLLNFVPAQSTGCPPGGMIPCDNNTLPGGLDEGDLLDFEHVILHEFGHAFGLRHEHARADSTCNATTEQLDQGVYDGEPVWAFDPSSVMSYCTSGNKLSVGDLRALHTLYPGVVGLYSGNDLASGSSTIALPVFVGPGYYTTTQIPTLTSTSSIVVPPGFRVRACTTSACAYFYSTSRTLSSTYNNAIVNLEVTPWVIGAANIGYGGTSERFGTGSRNASSFQVIGDNTMSSVFVPPTRVATVCAGSNGVAPCDGPHVGGSVPVAFKLPSGVDNAVSNISVAARVVTYSDRFSGASYALAPGTYKASTHAWLTQVRALSISGLDVRACTEEGTPAPLGGGGAGDCRNYVQSVDLAAAGHTALRYLKVTVPLENAPP